MKSKPIVIGDTVEFTSKFLFRRFKVRGKVLNITNLKGRDVAAIELESPKQFRGYNVFIKYIEYIKKVEANPNEEK